MTRKLNKQRTFLGLLVMAAVIVAAMSLVLRSPAEAASKKVPGKTAITKIVVVGKKDVALRWKKVPNATSYHVYYKQAGTKKWAHAAVLGSKTFRYVHKASNKKAPLTGGKRYTYMVRAYNGKSRRWGAYDKTGKTVTIPVIPGTVKVKSVKAGSYNRVTVTWTKAKGSTHYRVLYKKAGTKRWTLLAAVKAGTSSYTHRSSSVYPLKAGGKYVYTVRGYNRKYKTNGNYMASGVAVTLPEKPSARPTAVPEPTATPKPAETEEQQIARERKELIQMINEERVKDGTWALKEHAGLDKAAMIRAKECAVNYDHVRPDGRDYWTAVFDVGLGNPAGEILNGWSSPECMMESWMASSGHRAAIMQRGDAGATHLGVGFYNDKNGLGSCVVVFARNPDSKKTLTVDANGGVFPTKGGVGSYTMKFPEKMKVDSREIPIPEKDGYDFEKWTVIDNELNLEFQLPDSGYIGMGIDSTLKANWTESDSN